MAKPVRSFSLHRTPRRRAPGGAMLIVPAVLAVGALAAAVRAQQLIGKHTTSGHGDGHGQPGVRRHRPSRRHDHVQAQSREQPAAAGRRHGGGRSVRTARERQPHHSPGELAKDGLTLGANATKLAWTLPLPARTGGSNTIAPRRSRPQCQRARLTAPTSQRPPRHRAVSRATTTKRAPRHLRSRTRRPRRLRSPTARRRVTRRRRPSRRRAALHRQPIRRRPPVRRRLPVRRPRPARRAPRRPHRRLRRRAHPLVSLLPQHDAVTAPATHPHPGAVGSRDGRGAEGEAQRCRGCPCTDPQNGPVVVGGFEIDGNLCTTTRATPTGTLPGPSRSPPPSAADTSSFAAASAKRTVRTGPWLRPLATGSGQGRHRGHRQPVRDDTGRRRGRLHRLRLRAAEQHRYDEPPRRAEPEAERRRVVSLRQPGAPSPCRRSATCCWASTSRGSTSMTLAAAWTWNGSAWVPRSVTVLPWVGSTTTHPHPDRRDDPGGEFGEAAVNLTALFGPGSCSGSFGTLNVRTSASTTLTSNPHPLGPATSAGRSEHLPQGCPAEALGERIRRRHRPPLPQRRDHGSRVRQTSRPTDSRLHRHPEPGDHSRRAWIPGEPRRDLGQR